MAELVFVYGSLRQGQQNHGYLTSGCYLGDHRTAARFTMYDLGAFPAVRAGGCTAVLGELYAVPGGVLRALDQLEGHPDLYRRQRLPTPWGAAWIYLYRREAGQLPRVAGGNWVRWLAQRPVGFGRRLAVPGR